MADEKAAADRSRSPRRPSKLARNQVLSWAVGRISAAHLHSCMRDEVEDQGARALPLVQKIAALGGHQGSTRLPQRLVNMLRPKLPILDCIVSVPGGAVTQMISPQDVVAHVCRDSPHAFKMHLGADPAKVKRFWERLYMSDEGRRMFEEHGHLRGKTPLDLHHCLPLTLHEDAGPFTKTRGVNIISFAGLLGMGSEMQVKLPSFTYIKKAKADQAVPEAAWRRFILGFDRLADGHKHTGEPIAVDDHGNLWTCCMCFGKGDGDVHVNQWGLQGHGGPGEVCGFCLADRSDLNYLNLQEDSEWRATEIVTTAAFIARLRCPHHPLNDAPFFTLWFVRIDIMHNLDCKGVLSILQGGALWLVCHDTRRKLGNTIAARLQEINRRKDAFFKLHGVANRMPDIRAENISEGPDGFVTLSGTVVKAANTRALLPFVKELCCEVLNQRRTYHRSVCKLLESACGMVDTLYASEMFMSEEQQAAFRKHTLRVGRHWQLCCNIATEKGQPLWHITPKAHVCQHLPTQAKLLNPRFTQNYQEEGLIGKVTKVWKAAANGPYFHVAQKTVLEKWLVGFMITIGMPIE